MLNRQSVVTMTAVAGLIFTGCGKDESKDEENGLSEPASIVTEAAITPTNLKAFDAEAIKKDMEDAGSNFSAESPDDKSDPSCSDKITAAFKIEAKGPTLRLTFDADTSSCVLEDLKAEDSFKDADFTNITYSSSQKMVYYIRCEGADLTPYNGKSLDDIKDLPECDKANSVGLKFEFVLAQKTSGYIKLAGENPVNYTYETDYLINMVNRAEGGGLCGATLNAAEFTYANNCADISHSVITTKLGLQGSEELGADNGKVDYRKAVYSSVKRFAENKGPWYSSGTMNVTRNDWTGTVKFSSPTAEPIFEMKKGAETVTGTIKPEKASE
jgi:hypothetical protein